MSGVRRSVAGGGLVVGGEPRVQLLPPVVAQRVRERGLRRLAVVVLIGVSAAMGGGFVLANMQATQAQADLDAAHAETVRLLSEQQKYAEASTIAGVIGEIKESRSLALASEVMWSELFGEIQASLPAGVMLDTAILKAPPAWVISEAPVSLLLPAGVATMSLTVLSPTIPDSAALLRSLSKVTGYNGGSLNTVSGTGPYTAVMSVSFNVDILSGRFGQGYVEPEEGEVVPVTVVPAPTPTPEEEQE